jgi:hypothetical protein
MSKKQLDVSGVVNELKEGSVFFQKDTERTEKRTEQRPEIRSEKRTVRLPIKRSTKRYSFEFYEDQLAEIKRIKIETEMNGENISMSQIVREALDHYFETVRKSERSKERTQLRTKLRTEK